MIPEYTRHNDWWEHKITLLLSAGLLSIIVAAKPFTWGTLGHLGISLAAIIICAVYVCVINDFTDKEDDLKAGKKNRLVHRSNLFVFTLIGVLLTAGTLFFIYFLPDIKTAWLYLGSWIAYSLYSFPPIRLKKRSWMGALADAAGAHLFPTLTILSSMEFFLDGKFQTIFYVCLAIWSCIFGLRGIFWHQYSDLENDQISNINTLASKVDRSLIKQLEPFIIASELIAFGILIFITDIPILFLIAIFYFIYCWLQFRVYPFMPAIILIPETKRWYFFMSSFYQTAFPLTLIFILTQQSSGYLILIILYVLLFPKDIQYNIPIMRGIIQYYRSSSFRTSRT